MIAIFADDGVDDDTVARQALLDDPWRQWGRDHSKFLTQPAGSFLPFGDQYEVPCRLHIELGTLLVADRHCFFATPLAYALIRRAGQNPLHSRKIRRQFLATRMLAGSVRRAPHWRVLTLRRLDRFTDDELKFEQFHLRLRELFATGSVLLDPHQPQTLFQHANL